MDGELERLGERIAEQAAHLDAAMQRWLADLRSFDALGRLARAGCDVVCALARLAGRLGSGDRARARTGRPQARGCPVIDDALLSRGDRASVAADDRGSLEACS
jgi:hypothetical protein